MSMTTDEAWEALNDLDGRAVFMEQDEYERQSDALMAVIAADPSQQGVAITLWRLTRTKGGR